MQNAVVQNINSNVVNADKTLVFKGRIHGWYTAIFI